jgi:hypothetical protein
MVVLAECGEELLLAVQSFMVDRLDMQMWGVRATCEPLAGGSGRRHTLLQVCGTHSHGCLGRPPPSGASDVTGRGRTCTRPWCSRAGQWHMAGTMACAPFQAAHFHVAHFHACIPMHAPTPVASCTRLSINRPPSCLAAPLTLQSTCGPPNLRLGLDVDYGNGVDVVNTVKAIRTVCEQLAAVSLKRAVEACRCLSVCLIQLC